MSTPTKLVIAAGVILGLAVGVSAQSVPTTNSTVKVVRVAAVRVATVDGHANFDAYCASCHGGDGKGLGPACRGLEAPPANLTLIVVRHGDTFPLEHVRQTILGSHADGDLREMPDWGRILASVSTDGQQATLRLHNLVRYIESIQQR